MRCLGRLIGLGLVFIFLIVFPCSLWTFNTQRIVLDVDHIKKAFADEGFYRDLIPTVLPALLEGLEKDEAVPGEVRLLDVIKVLDKREWDRIAPTLVTKEWVEYEIEDNIEHFSEWVRDDRDELILVFHTDTLRRRLESSTGAEAIQRMIDALPPCSQSEEYVLAALARNGPTVDLPYCSPQYAHTRAALSGVLNQARLDAADELPDTFDVIEETEKASEEYLEPGQDTFTQTDLAQFRSSVRLWQRLLGLTLLVPVALLSLVVIFAVRSSKVFFRWMGWSVILGSLLALVPLFLLPFAMHDLLNVNREIEGGFATGGALLAEIVGNRMIRLIVSALTWPVLMQSAALIMGGFLAVVLSVLLPDPDAPPDPDVMTYITGALPDDTPSAERTPPPTGTTNHV
ncbi:MAG: hypothetical protein JXQ72_12645 [Anaerolineae bacterium]|nr:hypothetical protein [Anaerolineae bacterium]